jgi:hypothetical protein
MKLAKATRLSARSVKRSLLQPRHAFRIWMFKQRVVKRQWLQKTGWSLQSRDPATGLLSVNTRWRHLSNNNWLRAAVSYWSLWRHGITWMERCGQCLHSRAAQNCLIMLFRLASFCRSCWYCVFVGWVPASRPAVCIILRVFIFQKRYSNIVVLRRPWQTLQRRIADNGRFGGVQLVAQPAIVAPCSVCVSRPPCNSIKM